jgi:bacteriorhodopsin
MFGGMIAAISVTCGEIGICANKTKTLDKGFTNIASLIIELAGGLAVLFILWGGFRYVISRGDPGNIKSAKDTILYAVIGLIVAIAAYGIVAYIATSFG